MDRDTEHNQPNLVADKKALRILLDTFWSSAGWKRTFTTDPADLAYAIAAGYMFPPEAPEARSHDAVGECIRAALRVVTPRQVAAAFLASLSRRQPVLRAALASYSLARVFPSHTERRDGPSRYCAICGYRCPADRNFLNFERFKWGGVRHLDPYFVAFNLEQFARLEVPPPLEEDLDLFRRIVETARALPSTARARDLEKAVGTFLPSNKAERETLLEILGIAGVLAGDDHPGFLDGWIPPAAQTLPPVSRTDWLYPICWWRGGMVSDRALRHVFAGFSWP